MNPELRDLYQDVILDHGRNPRNHGRPEDANREARGDNPMCGDRVTVFLCIDEDGTIRDIGFDGRGCAISQASASMMTELVKGRTEAEAKALFARFHALCTGDEQDHGSADVPTEDVALLEVMSGVRQFPMRVKCATLAWHTLTAALAGEPCGTSE